MNSWPDLLDDIEMMMGSCGYAASSMFKHILFDAPVTDDLEQDIQNHPDFAVAQRVSQNFMIQLITHRMLGLAREQGLLSDLDLLLIVQQDADDFPFEKNIYSLRIDETKAAQPESFHLPTVIRKYYAELPDIAPQLKKHGIDLIQTRHDLPFLINQILDHLDTHNGPAVLQRLAHQAMLNACCMQQENVTNETEGHDLLVIEQSVDIIKSFYTYNNFLQALPDLIIPETIDAEDVVAGILDIPFKPAHADDEFELAYSSDAFTRIQSSLNIARKIIADQAATALMQAQSSNFENPSHASLLMVHAEKLEKYAVAQDVLINLFSAFQTKHILTDADVEKHLACKADHVSYIDMEPYRPPHSFSLPDTLSVMLDNTTHICALTLQTEERYGIPTQDLLHHLRVAGSLLSTAYRKDTPPPIVAVCEHEAVRETLADILELSTRNDSPPAIHKARLSLPRLFFENNDFNAVRKSLTTYDPLVKKADLWASTVSSGMISESLPVFILN